VSAPQVEPIPESLLDLVWDYGTLNVGEEKRYITAMLQVNLNTQPTAILLSTHHCYTTAMLQVILYRIGLPVETLYLTQHVFAAGHAGRGGGHDQRHGRVDRRRRVHPVRLIFYNI
jgi:hypothetical protein